MATSPASRASPGRSSPTPHPTLAAGRRAGTFILCLMAKYRGAGCCRGQGNHPDPIWEKIKTSTSTSAKAWKYCHRHHTACWELNAELVSHLDPAANQVKAAENPVEGVPAAPPPMPRVRCTRIRLWPPDPRQKYAHCTSCICDTFKAHGHRVGGRPTHTFGGRVCSSSITFEVAFEAP
ncbi:hypothetical protein B0H10DRAFT_1961541 [Mycena sp. CBHHK59/15]|nr:hypothetical protein B0H10DRAFT_1961541 [Mycena sp. CBHHK59/15]